MTYHTPRFVDLIGKPFVYGGRGPATYDCWGVLMEMNRRAYGIELPDYRSPSLIREIAVAIAGDLHRWRRLNESRPGSSILFRIDDPKTSVSAGAHVGFQLDHMRFLHTWESAGGVLQERFDVNPWKNRIIGHYEFIG